MTGITIVPIHEIVVPERRRQELGDLKALARSINQYGLLHPIIVSGRELVAGERRLRAMQQAGYQSIEVRDWGDLDDETRQAIELEENERRKALTPIEKSRQVVRRANDAREFLTDSVKNSTDAPLRGRGQPSKADAEQKQAEFIGEKRQTLRDARAHVAAVEQFPELEPLNQAQAIKAAGTLRALPAPEQGAVREQVREQMAKRATLPPKEQPPIDLEKALAVIPEVAEAHARAKLIATYSTLMQHAGNLARLVPADVVAAMKPDHRQTFAYQARALRAWLDQMQAELDAPTGLRLLGGNG